MFLTFLKLYRWYQIVQSISYIYCRPFKITKTTSIVWLKQEKINILNWAIKTIFYFKKSFFTRNIARPPSKYLWQELFKSSWAFTFFSDHPFSKSGKKVVFPNRKERGLILCCTIESLLNLVYLIRWLQIERNLSPNSTKPIPYAEETRDLKLCNGTLLNYNSCCLQTNVIELTFTILNFAEIWSLKKALWYRLSIALI